MIYFVKLWFEGEAAPRRIIRREVVPMVGDRLLVFDESIALAVKERIWDENKSEVVTLLLGQEA